MSIQKYVCGKIHIKFRLYIKQTNVGSLVVISGPRKHKVLTREETG